MAKVGVCVDCHDPVANGSNRHAKGGCRISPADQREALDVSGGPILIQQGRIQLNEYQMQEEARQARRRQGLY